MSVAVKHVRRAGLGNVVVGRAAKAVVEGLESRTLLSGDGLSGWAGYAPASASAGLVVEPAALTVLIPDANLEAAIRTALGKPTGDITDTDLASLTTLTVNKMDVVSLTGLEYATGLTSLDVSDNFITDVSPLAGLTQLQVLNIGDNQLTSIAPVAGLTQVWSFDASKNMLTDISPLASMTSLGQVFLWNNMLTDITPMSGLTQLFYVDVTGNGLDLNPTSPSMMLIQSWIDAGKSVDYLPQGTATNMTPTDILLSSNTILPDLPAGTVVGTLNATDPNIGDTFTFALVDGVGGENNASFTIVGNQLQTAASLGLGTYSVLVQVTDAGGLTFQKALTVNVAAGPVNEAPTDIALSNVAIDAGLPAGTVVGTLSTTDPNAGDTFTYALVAGVGGENNASFTIVGSALQTAASLDAGTYSALVQTTDAGGLTFQKAFTVTVAAPPANEAPTDIALTEDTIMAGLPAGTVVGTLSATDPNPGDTFTFALVDGVGGEDNASFAIVGGQLQTAAALDAGTYSVLVQVTDAGGLTFEEPLTITVAANEAPTDVALTNDTIGAGLAAGTVVGSLVATDPNPGDTFTYALVDGVGGEDNASFAIVGGQLQTAATLDVGTYSVLVEVTDAGGLTFVKSLTVTVAANEAPTDIALSNSFIDVGLPAGTVVGTLSTTDPNVGDSFTYALVDGAGGEDNASFVIVGDQLQTAASLDAGTYAVLVQVTDVGGLTFEKSFTVTVAPNEAPTDIALSNDTIDTGSPAGTVVGTFSTTDPNPGDTFTYALVPGVGGEDNASFTIVGDELQTAADLPEGTYSVLVEVTDAGGLTFDKVFAVTVAAPVANEAPTDISISEDTIDAGQPAGTVVGTLSATDPNAGDTFTFALVDGTGGEDNASFTIVGNELQTATSLDAGTYSVLVRVTDSGGLTFDKALTINVVSGPESRGQFGKINGKTVSLRNLVDVDGDLVTIMLTGGGTGEVFGTGGTFDDIMLTGTTNKSVLTIKVRKMAGGDGAVTIGNITSDGLLKAIKASSAIVSGAVELNTMDTSPGKSAVSLQFQQLRDASIHAQNLPISSLKALNWADTDGSEDVLTAPAIGSVTVSGRKEKAKTAAIEFLPGDLDASIMSDGTIKAIKVAGNLTGDIRAGQDAKGVGIGSISAERITGATIATTGSIRTFKAESLVDSNILVGVARDFDGDFADVPSDFSNPMAKLGTLSVTGEKQAKGVASPAFVVDSNISAPNVGKISLVNVPLGSGPIVHVLNDTGVLKVSQTKLTTEPMVAKGTFKAPLDDTPLWEVA